MDYAFRNTLTRFLLGSAQFWPCLAGTVWAQGEAAKLRVW